MKIINILPRNMGKSKICKNEFIRNAEDSLYVAYNYESLERQFGRHVNKQRVTTATLFEANTRGNTYNSIYFDDYFKYTTKHYSVIKQRIPSLSIDNNINIFAFGSIENQIPIHLFNEIKKCKINNRTPEYLKGRDTFLRNDLIDWLYNSFITDIDTIICIGPPNLNLPVHDNSDANVYNNIFI